MRLIARNDLFLLVGLTIALFAMFSRPLSRVLEYAYRIDQDRDLYLLPGLVVLAVVYMFHQQRKRLEIRAQAAGAAAQAREATARAAEMERLVVFGQALARSRDPDAIRIAANEHLPAVAAGRGIWAMIRTAGHWQPLTVIGRTSQIERERAARRALGESEPATGPWTSASR